MLSEEEEREIRDGSYIPEHNYLYVSGVSNLKPKFIRPYLVYEGAESVVIVGYPIGEKLDERRLTNLVNEYLKEKKRISIITPFKILNFSISNSDFYYILELENLNLTQKTKNMLARAKKEISVQVSRTIGKEHMDVVEEFIKEKGIDENMAWILRRIDSYISRSEEAVIISATDRSGRIVAFNVVDLFSREYAFFMFSLRRIAGFIPGTSDLLFYEMARFSQSQGKKFINLGLGINSGVKFFKEKWGGKPFLPYYLHEKKKFSFLQFLDKILRS